MRFYKVLLKFVVVICVLIITVYIFQTDNFSIISNSSSTTSFFRNLDYEHSSKQKVLGSKNQNSLSSVISEESNPHSIGVYSNNSTNNFTEYNVWCIFTKVKHETFHLRYKFERFINSVIRHSSIVITLNIISDNNSRTIAKSVISKQIQKTGRNVIKMIYHDVENMTDAITNLTAVMQPAFSPQRGGYYSDALFYISLELYKLVDPLQTKAIMIDIDTEMRADILLLFKLFDSFDDEELLGLAPELSPVYQHVMYLYRSRNKDTKFGSPLSAGGFPGLNSGVVLFRFDRIRSSSLYKSLMTEEAVVRLLEKYSFMGHLGDQDMYTLIKMEYPQLIHMLPCGWNRQLCKWWRDHGYPEVFKSFARCNGPIYLYHGNCNTHIPRNRQS